MFFQKQSGKYRKLPGMPQMVEKNASKEKLNKEETIKSMRTRFLM